MSETKHIFLLPCFILGYTSVMKGWRYNMTNKASIYLRESSTERKIKITSNKPDIGYEMLETWQNLVDILASLLNVSSALITKVEEKTLDIVVASGNEDNPFLNNPKSELGHGLYNEQTLGSVEKFYVKNAAEEELWKDAPSSEFNMISYYGMPIKWPDGEFFGTICILNDKPIILEGISKSLFREFQKVVEGNLQSLVQSELLEYYSYKDELTGLYNRRKIKQEILNEFSRSRRSLDTFSIMLIDLDRFKLINDSLGQQHGDSVLKFFSDILLSRLRSIDILGRWGGDEFVILCPGTDIKGAKRLKEDLVNAVENHCVQNMPDLSCSIGMAEYQFKDESIDDMFRRAEIELYREKNNIKSKL